MNVVKPADVSAAERQVRIDLAACYRLVAHFGMDDLVYTHITARVPGSRDQFLINPFGTMFSEVTASSLVKIDTDGNVISPRKAKINPAGFVVHSAIHMHRHDAGCVLHTHTEAGMAVAAMKEGLLPLNQKSMIFHNRVGYHDYEGLAFSTDERLRLYRDLGNHKALILRHHGLLVVGEDCADAFSLMYSLEVACRLQVAALSMNRAIDLPDPKVSEHTAHQFESYPDPARTREWPGLLRLLDRIDPSYAQ
ncbi:MAG: class II aldolase/adducin family protein [Alphaproteobacteria bacterium]|nr:class II aldolase/adducin family protein [Alphaproteobacteria bacterium]